ncbi:MAG: hypothetical protein HN402_10965 [Candidatus Scalindua sp.]|nr:hypothetical protein [Candidatus Scalindua sp.]
MSKSRKNSKFSISGGIPNKLGRKLHKKLSFDSAQDDVTLSRVKALSTLNFLI